MGLVQALLRSTRDVRILATSRTALNVAGEIAWPMPPLSVPAARERDEVDTVLTFESVALFIDRAMAVRPSFAVTAGNAAAVSAAPTAANMCGPSRKDYSTARKVKPIALSGSGLP